jgi:hypothetical protein
MPSGVEKLTIARHYPLHIEKRNQLYIQGYRTEKETTKAVWRRKKNIKKNQHKPA